VRLFWAAVAFAYGAVLGSFLGLCAGRLAKGESVVRPGSRCDSCGYPLAPGDLVPVASWLLLRGRCRYCGSRIPARLVLLEAGLGAAAFLSVWFCWR
jgi:leader peptidase (prepilin peptidase)/N-methyltransferase